MSDVSCHGIEHLDSSVAECVTHVPGLFCYPSPRTAPRRFLVQCFVRAFVVVLVTKPIEPDLLGAQIGARGTRGLGFQRPMHPLMAPVLLRGRGGDQFREDPEPNPPDGQRGQAPERGSGEGHAIVGPDDPRQAVLLEEAGGRAGEP